MFNFEVMEKILPEVISYINKVRTDIANFIRPPQPVVTPEQQKVKASKLFEEQWLITKAALLEGRDLTENKNGSPNPNKKRTMEVVLDNTRKNLMHMQESSQASNVATLNKIILPVIRRVIPNLLANDIICVQPICGPVSEVHTLRGTTIGNRQALNIVKEIIEVKTRKLAARWTFEAAQDAKINIDIEAEIMAALAQEITAEYDCEMIACLKGIVGEPKNTFDVHNELHPTGTPTFVGDIYDKFIRMIDAEASAIGERVKRGSGNWCIVSEKAYTALKSSTFSSFKRVSDKSLGGVKFVGTLNETINVYCDPYASNDASILVGYKGSDIDGPAVFAPYIPLISSGVIIDPHSFEPVVSFMTRYGFMTLEKGKYDNETKDYLGTVGFKPETVESFV